MVPVHPVWDDLAASTRRRAYSAVSSQGFCGSFITLIPHLELMMPPMPTDVDETLSGVVGRAEAR